MTGADRAARAIALEPIGVLHTPFHERVDAPRQAVAAPEVEARAELFPGRGFEDALVDLEQWDYLWLLVWFHQNANYRPKVLPPRSTRKRGVFATRAPYRPNPIGLSAVRLVRVEGLTLVVAGVDLLDGTPLLDVKPYVPYSDAIPHAGHGWLDSERPGDPQADYAVSYAPLAAQQLDFLSRQHALELAPRIESALKLGPTPHAYRRIRAEAEGYRLAVKDWRAHFAVEERVITVRELKSGYRPRELFAPEGTAPAAHKAFVAAWPNAIDP
jgi:tRNA-Thr(GGU) m(6)t(6)A37 methyltransferase TsaA